MPRFNKKIYKNLLKIALMPSSLTPLLTSNIRNTTYDKFHTRNKTEKTEGKEEQDAVYNAKNLAWHTYSSVRNATALLKLNGNAAATK